MRDMPALRLTRAARPPPVLWPAYAGRVVPGLNSMQAAIPGAFAVSVGRPGACS